MAQNNLMPQEDSGLSADTRDHRRAAWRPSLMRHRKSCAIDGWIRVKQDLSRQTVVSRLESSNTIPYRIISCINLEGLEIQTLNRQISSTIPVHTLMQARNAFDAPSFSSQPFSAPPFLCSTNQNTLHTQKPFPHAICRRHYRKSFSWPT